MISVRRKDCAARLVGVFTALFGLVFAATACATGITGTYTGTYGSFTDGGDSGTVTLTVDAYGAVKCDFYSTKHKTHYIADGSANASPSGTSVSYGSAGQPMGTPIPLTATSINCVNGPRINSGGPESGASNPDSSSTFFAAQINLNWAPSVGVASFSQGTWISADGDAGEFSIDFPSSSDSAAAVNPNALTGSWYDPTYTGAGFSITGAAAGLMVTYYGWDKTGERLWLISAVGPSEISLGQSITLELGKTAGGGYATPAPPSTIAVWGTLTLTFTSCTTATATLDGSDGRLTESLTLLAGVENLGCQ
ncbi:MAG: hypothetical protein ABI304_05500 [Rudaea sp.]